jgi:hypothetical protein
LDWAVFQLTDFEQVESPLDFLFPFGAALFLHFEAEGQVSLHIQVGKEAVALEYGANVALLRG